MTYTDEQIDAATIAEWREKRDHGMISAIGEYTPEEFWTLLDAYERLVLALGQAQGEPVAWDCICRAHKVCPQPFVCARADYCKDAAPAPTGEGKS